MAKIRIQRDQLDNAYERARQGIAHDNALRTERADEEDKLLTPSVSRAAERAVLYDAALRMERADEQDKLNTPSLTRQVEAVAGIKRQRNAAPAELPQTLYSDWLAEQQKKPDLSALLNTDRADELDKLNTPSATRSALAQAANALQTRKQVTQEPTPEYLREFLYKAAAGLAGIGAYDAEYSAREPSEQMKERRIARGWNPVVSEEEIQKHQQQADSLREMQQQLLDAADAANQKNRARDALRAAEKYRGAEYGEGLRGIAGASYAANDLSQESGYAWNRYVTNPTPENEAIALLYDNALRMAQENNREALAQDGLAGRWASSAAGYLPQLRNQTAAGIKGGLAGAGVGALAASLPGAITGAKQGAAIGRAADMYALTRGSAFKSLLDAGATEEQARQMVNDEALLSSLIEYGDTLADFALLGVNNAAEALMKYGAGAAATEAGKSAGKKALRAILGYLGNAAGEYAEEFAQEGVSIANENRLKNGTTDSGTGQLARDALGVIWNAGIRGDDKEAQDRMREAGREGFRVGALYGGATAGVNYALQSGLNRSSPTRGAEALLDAAEQVRNGGTIREDTARALLRSRPALDTLQSTGALTLTDDMTQEQRTEAVQRAVAAIVLRDREENADAEGNLTGEANRGLKGEKTGNADGLSPETESGEPVGNSDRLTERLTERLTNGLTNAPEAALAAAQPEKTGISAGQSTLAAGQRLNLTEQNAVPAGQNALLPEQNLNLTEREAGELPQPQLDSSPMSKETGEETEVYNGRTGDEPALRVRDSGERLEGANPGGELRDVEGAAGRDQETGQLVPARSADQGEAGGAYAWVSRAADKEAGKLTYARETGSTAALGIRGGLDSDTLHFVADGQTEATKKAFAAARQRGLELILFAGGDLHTENVRDGARGYYDAENGVIYVRADDPDYTSAQIVDHEIGHDRIARGEVDLAAVRRKCREIAPGGNVDALAEMYAAAYEESGLTPEEAWEECVCDSLAGMNVFGAVFESAREEYAGAMEQIRSAAQETSEARGPPSENAISKASINSGLKNELDAVRRNIFPAGKSEVYIGTTSDFLTKEIGADALDVTMPAEKAYAAMVSEEQARRDNRYRSDLNYHNLGEDGLRRILEASENPVAAFADVPDGKNTRRDRIVLITDQVIHGAPAAVIEQVNTKALRNGKRIDANKVITTYDRAQFLSDITKAAEENRLLHLDMEKSQPLIAGVPGDNSPAAMRNAATARLLNAVRATDYKKNIAAFWADVKWKKSGAEMYTAEDRSKTPTAMQAAMQKAMEDKAQRETHDPKSEASRRLKNLEELREENDELRARAAELAGARREAVRQGARAEYWKGQTKRTAEPSVRPGDVDKLARTLLDGYSSTADAETLKAALTDAGNYLLRESGKKGFSYDELKSRVLPAARELVQNAEKLVNADDMRDYAEIKKLLRQKVRITAAEAEHIADFEAWKKKYRNRLHIAVGGDATPMDVRYMELSDAWPSLFPADILAPVDQLLRMGEVLDSLRPIYENPYSYDMAAATEYCANEIVDALLADRVRQTAPTFADRQATKQADALLAGQMNQGAKMAEELRRAEERHQRSRERAAEALDRERARRTEQVKAAYLAGQMNQGAKMAEQMRRAEEKRREHQAEMRERQAERKADAKARDRLLRIAKRLKSKKLPAVSRALVDQYIGELDTVSKSLTEKSVMKLSELREWYEDQKDNNPDFIPDARTEERLKRLSRMQIKDLTPQQVAELTEVLLNIENEMQNQRKLIDSEDRRDTYLQGVQVIGDVENSLGTKAGSWTRKADELIVNGTLSPVRAVRRMVGYADNDPLYRLTNALADGQRKMLDYQRRAGSLFTQWTENKKLTERIKGKNAEGIEIQGSEEGEPVTVTISPAMRMSLYLHSLNAQNMKHISGYTTKADQKTYRETGELEVSGNRGGGLTVPDWELYRKGKLAEAYNNGRTIKLTPSEVKAAIAGMSAEEKAFADAAHDYFNRMSREELNAVSEKLLGYSLAEVEDYFPIETDKNFIQKDFDSLKFDGTIEGMGFTKERVDSAKPVMLYDMDDVLQRSIENHAKYVGLAIPVRNFNKVWGVTKGSYDAEGNRNSFEGSVMQAVRRKWGDAGFDYIEKMMSDLQGGSKRSKGWEALLGAARSNYAGAVLTLNAGVALKQAASYPTAGAVVGGKALAKALANNEKADRALIDRYTPLLWYRSQGYGTKELGDLAKQGKQIPKVLNWIQGMDVWTTTKLWKAAEFYVQDNQKDLTVGSEPYYRAVADVYNRIIEETQPNYTTMQRPQLLRSDSPLTQSLHMFKTQPYQNFNILYDAVGNLNAKRAAFVNLPKDADAETKKETEQAYREAKTGARRAIVSQALAAVVFAGMTAGWKWLRGEDDDYRDEDGNGGLLSAAFWKRLGLDTIGSLVGVLPFGSDLWELAESKISGKQYNGFDEITTSAINDYIKALGTAYKALGEVWTDAKGGDGIDWNELRLKLAGVSKTMGRALNWPVENVANMFDAAAWHFLRITQGEYKGRYAYLRLTASPSGKSQQYYDNLYRAMENDRTAYEEIYQSMIASGDFSEEKVKNAMESRMKKAQGVSKVKEMESRYLTPEAENEYNRVMEQISKTRIWELAGNREGLQDKTEQRLYDLAMGTKTGNELREKIDAGAVYGLDETEYLLYRTALDTVDKPTESGKYGSYTEEEVEAAIRVVPGLTKEERDYLWLAQGKSEKSMPKW